ncbi:Hypothetical predicted protein [Mytilus galloprovincialis]|uniref:Reverse transcriptase domain-containing protein n=1 Tax=Mytilus galloprovincialis TaxID=29158 RepID=A0A8B6CAI8_MYTGA|nr:Hypothetical predicted protein [Mytilus galloprovincialis]
MKIFTLIIAVTLIYNIGQSIFNEKSWDHRHLLTNLLNNKWSSAGRKPMTLPVKPNKNYSMAILILLLAGDIEQNPGPRTKQQSIYPCGLCEHPVTWNCEGGDKHAPENYRPVSLTSVPCKLLEHIICRHILKHLEKHRVLTSLNHGFRSGYSCETQLLVTLHDFMKAFDAGKQIDVAILDFSKAFDTVPHNKLLHKMNEYGIRGPLNKWLEMFLTQRKMKAVVDGEESEEASVDSGVPQGTVLGPLLFLCHINDLPDSVQSSVRLFADDCLLYRNINSQHDHTLLQRDLQNLEVWATNWGMRFNAKKCYILSIKNKSQKMYSLDGHCLITFDVKFDKRSSNYGEKRNNKVMKV